jgi:predicted metal-binding membrane protein
MRVASPPLWAERRLVLAVLLLLAAAGWALVLWQAAVMDRSDAMGLDLTMGMAAPLFLAMWVAMMVGMMFPASAPMILAFTRSQARRRDEGAEYTPTWLFVVPYVAVWTAFGAIGYGIAAGVDSLADDSMWAMDNLPRIAGSLLVAAGIYQLTPLKRVCLARCRSPFSFMLSYWRDGRWGAVSLGLRHGLFCLGCCWVLFLVLLPLGVMNIGAMLAVAALVFAEKALPKGDTVARVAAVVLVVYGLLAIAVPDALPTMM